MEVFCSFWACIINTSLLLLRPLGVFGNPSPEILTDDRSRRTLEAGRETGSNAKWLIRRPCSCAPWRDFDNSFNVDTSLPDISFEIASSPLSGSISSSTLANRTVGDPSPASFSFPGTAVVVIWSEPARLFVSNGLVSWRNRDR
jgi:hypothetical protein